VVLELRRYGFLKTHFGGKWQAKAHTTQPQAGLSTSAERHNQNLIPLFQQGSFIPDLSVDDDGNPALADR